MADDDRPGASLAARIEEDLGDALQRIGRDLLGRAVPLAPIDESTLRGSGHVEPQEGAERRDGMLQVRVAFNTPYAEVQHERLDYHHDEGQAKYLEAPLKEMAPRYEAIVGAVVARAAERG